MNRHDASRSVDAALQRHAETFRREMLPIGFRWPAPLEKPDDAAANLVTARATRERRADELERVTASATTAVAEAQEARIVAQRARAGADDLKGRRARQVASAAETGVVPDDLVTADSVDVAAAHAAKLEADADKVRGAALRSDQIRADAVHRLGVAGDDVRIGEALVIAATLIEPMTALRESLRGLTSSAHTMAMWDRVSAAVARACEDALGRKLNPFGGNRK